MAAILSPPASSSLLLEDPIVIQFNGIQDKITIMQRIINQNGKVCAENLEHTFNRYFKRTNKEQENVISTIMQTNPILKVVDMALPPSSHYRNVPHPLTVMLFRSTAILCGRQYPTILEEGSANQSISSLLLNMQTTCMYTQKDLLNTELRAINHISKTITILTMSNGNTIRIQTQATTKDLWILRPIQDLDAQDEITISTSDNKNALYNHEEVLSQFDLCKQLIIELVNIQKQNKKLIEESNSSKKIINAVKTITSLPTNIVDILSSYYDPTPPKLLEKILSIED